MVHQVISQRHRGRRSDPRRPSGVHGLSLLSISCYTLLSISLHRCIVKGPCILHTNMDKYLGSDAAFTLPLPSRFKPRPFLATVATSWKLILGFILSYGSRVSQSWPSEGGNFGLGAPAAVGDPSKSHTTDGQVGSLLVDWREMNARRKNRRDDPYASLSSSACPRSLARWCW